MQPHLKIKSTTDYSLFKFIDGNRAIAHQVARLVTEIGWKNQLKNFPILVFQKGGKLHIADGQKRFAAAQTLGLPIYYHVASHEISLEEISRFNSQQKGWSLLNYLDSFCAKGLPQYEQLRTVVSAYDLPISIAVEIYGGGSNGVSQIDLFKSGDFEIKNAKFAELVVSILRHIAPLLKFRPDRGFIAALSRAVKRNNFGVGRFVRKASVAPFLLTKCACWRDYMRTIEDVYNYRARQTDRISLA
jgi:hypothetical protein